MSQTRFIAAVNFPTRQEHSAAIKKAEKKEGKRGFSRYVRKLIKAKK